LIFHQNLFFHDKCKKPKLGKKRMDWFMSDRHVMPHGMTCWHAFSEHSLNFYIWLTWHRMPFIFEWHGMAWHGMFWVDGKESQNATHCVARATQCVAICPKYEFRCVARDALRRKNKICS
jgi:hypothetical protein